MRTLLNRCAVLGFALAVVACGGGDGGGGTSGGGDTDPDVGGFDAGGEDTGGEDTGGEDAGEDTGGDDTGGEDAGEDTGGEDTGGEDAGQDTGGEDTGEDVGPPPTPRSIAFTGAGGGVTSGSNIRAVVGFGAPQPMGTVGSDSTNVTLGPAAARP